MAKKDRHGVKQCSGKNDGAKKAVNFYFRKIGSQYLLTNDIGNHIFLSRGDFEKFIGGALEVAHPMHGRLSELGFLRGGMNAESMIEQYRLKNAFLNQGPSLHIVVATLRCNHQCVYCHASAQHIADARFDMDKKTAKKVVDTIFASPSSNLVVEFQGGEPLLNWGVVCFIAEYARKKAARQKKNLEIRLVTNLYLMTDATLQYCYDHEISISTSLDGHEKLHNKNRKTAANRSHRVATRWLKKASVLYRRGKDGFNMYLPGAVLTVSRETLRYPKEVVDEYVRCGLDGVFLRPLNPYGVAREQWRAIDYTADEFLKFYRKAMDYIIYLNKKGKKIKEMTAAIMLVKILLGEDPNYMELRSPCGAGIGQLAYNYNGDVYTCDEGRMLSMMGDKTFKLGNVHDNKYADFIENDVTKSMCVASCLEGQPLCSHCAFKPYCGICPIYNYSVQGSIFGNMPSSERCKISMGIFDYLFRKLKDDKIKTIFYNWTIRD